jgi:hypothetical protein
MIDGVKETEKKLAIEAGRAVLDDAKKTVENASVPTKIKIIGAVVGVVVVGVAVMALIAKLWMYAIGLAIVGGVGFAGYLAVKPKLLSKSRRRPVGVFLTWILTPLNKARSCISMVP